MPKLTQLVKSIRSSGIRNGVAPPPDPSETRLKRSQLPPYPKGLINGVCGVINQTNPDRNIYVIDHDHADEIVAVTNAHFACNQELLEGLQESKPFLFFEEFNNKFTVIKEWAVTEHIGWFDRPDGTRKLERTTTYCYKFTPGWLEAMLSFSMDYAYIYIGESFEAHVLLTKARAEGAIPLCHWQPRDHVNTGLAITSRDLQDGFLLDNRDKPSRAPNVIPKCVPSLLDIKKSPERWRNHPYFRFIK